MRPCQPSSPGRATRDVQLRPQLVDARNEERNAEGTTHHRVLVVHTLTKAEREVAHGLGDALDLDAARPLARADRLPDVAPPAL